MKSKIYISILLLVVISIWYYNFRDNLIDLVFINPRYLQIGFTIILAIISTYTVSKIIDLLFNNAFAKRLKNDSLGKKILPLAHNVIIISVWVLGFLLTVNILWFNINTFLAWAGIGWLMIALASKEAASNLFGSLSLIFSKLFKIWDLIKIKNYEWTVEEITLSYTKLLSKNGSYIFIPNKNILSEGLENLSNNKYSKQEINIPLSINLGSKEVSELMDSFEKYWDKLVKSKILINYKVQFDSFNEKTQNIIFSFQLELKSDSTKIKNEAYLELKKIMESKT